MFIGAGAIIAQPPPADPLVVALAHGLALGVMVSATGHVSGGHINPAVTFGALLGRQMSLRLAVTYWIAQLLAALAAAGALVAVFPADAWQAVTLGTPQVASDVSAGVAVLIEAILTFFLVFAVYGTGIDPKGSFHAVGGFAIGLTLAADILVGGPLTGAAVNPARWFGPAVFASAFDLWYVYWIGPLLGGAIAGLVYSRILLERRREA